MVLHVTRRTAEPGRGRDTSIITIASSRQKMKGVWCAWTRLDNRKTNGKSPGNVFGPSGWRGVGGGFTWERGPPLLKLSRAKHKETRKSTGD